MTEIWWMMTIAPVTAQSCEDIAEAEPSKEMKPVMMATPLMEIIVQRIAPRVLARVVMERFSLSRVKCVMMLTPAMGTIAPATVSW